jgi:hypothetical protein
MSCCRDQRSSEAEEGDVDQKRTMQAAISRSIRRKIDHKARKLWFDRIKWAMQQALDKWTSQDCAKVLRNGVKRCGTG